MQIENIEQRQAMLAAIIDSSEDAIISKDLGSRITSWNRAAERMFGYSEEEMIGQLIHVLIPEDRYAEEDEIISSLRQGKRVEHFETIRLTKSGREIQISLTISPIRNSVGVITGASKIARDITKQKQNEERLKVINEISKSISAQLDTDTLVQMVSDAATRLSGAAFGAFFYNRIDTHGESHLLSGLSGAPREAFGEKLTIPRTTAIFKQTVQGIGVFRSDDISTVPGYGKINPHTATPMGKLPVISYMAVPVISQNGIALGGIFLGHPKAGMFKEEHEDLISAIASQAAIALDNARLYEEINLLNSRKDQFIGFASHELKTPLTTLKGYLQIAELTDIPFKEFFPKINKQIKRLEGIIADLLDISKIQAQKLDLLFEKIRLADLIAESIELVDINKHFLKVDNPIADVTVVVDSQKLSQVLVNVISNAVKYSPPETVIQVDALKSGDQIQISITDHGIGIPEGQLEQIFNQFYRVSSQGNKIKGSGLGLFISKEIIEAHSGKIWVESELGKGSSFHILFPIERSNL